MHPAVRPTEIALPVRRRRVRAQRILCLGLLPLLGAPLVLLGHDGPPVPAAGAQVAVRSVGGRSSTSPAPPPAVAAVPIRSLRQTPVTAPPTTVAPTTTEPPTTAAPTTTAAPATTTTSAPPPTTAVPAKPAAAPVPAPTTAAPPVSAPSHPSHSQSGQATWYRWKAGNCAHNSLPKGTVVTVRATASGRTTTCTVGDRGAFREPTIIDLDASVFEKIAPLGAGRIAVTISWQ
ncbi:hypothetical protein BH10ACT1_BH10ACT1_15840 [soil metagenome]